MALKDWPSNAIGMDMDCDTRLKTGIDLPSMDLSPFSGSRWNYHARWTRFALVEQRTAGTLTRSLEAYSRVLGVNSIP
jgi:hypothetical protein